MTSRPAPSLPSSAAALDGALEAQRYEHDCDDCLFLGHHEDSDLWFCEQGGHPTVIARASSEPSDYSSGLGAAYQVPNLSAARDRAHVLGLIPWESGRI